jgi:hypothetical protein
MGSGHATSSGSTDLYAISKRRQASVDELTSKLGRQWLLDAVAKDIPHPLVDLYREYTMCGGHANLFAENTGCARLAFAAADVTAAWDVLTSLRGGESALRRDMQSTNEVWGVLGEAFVAVELGSAGVEVRPGEVGRGRSPDLLALSDGNVKAEVEAKVRHYSANDRESWRFWKNLYERLEPHLRNSGWACEIDYAEKCPPFELLEPLAMTISERLAAPCHQFKMDFQSFGVRARRLAGLRTNPRDLLIQVERLGEFAVFEGAVRPLPTFAGRLDHAVSCWRRRSGGHLAGLRRCMRNAGKKFSGTHPSLVVVLLSDEVASAVWKSAASPSGALFDLANAFAGYLKRTYFKRAPNVSEVRLYVQSFPLVDGVVERHVGCFGVRNEKALHPLSQGFGLKSASDFEWIRGPAEEDINGKSNRN